MVKNLAQHRSALQLILSRRSLRFLKNGRFRKWENQRLQETRICRDIPPVASSNRRRLIKRRLCLFHPPSSGTAESSDARHRHRTTVHRGGGCFNNSRVFERKRFGDGTFNGGFVMLPAMEFATHNHPSRSRSDTENRSSRYLAIAPARISSPNSWS